MNLTRALARAVKVSDSLVHGVGWCVNRYWSWRVGQVQARLRALLNEDE